MINITHLMRVEDGPPVRWVGRTDRDEEVEIRFSWGMVVVRLDGRHVVIKEVTWMLMQWCSDEQVRRYLAGVAQLPAVIDLREGLAPLPPSPVEKLY